MPTHTKNRLWITVEEKKNSLLNLLSFHTKKDLTWLKVLKTAETLNQEAIIYNEMLTRPLKQLQL